MQPAQVLDMQMDLLTRLDNEDFAISIGILTDKSLNMSSHISEEQWQDSLGKRMVDSFKQVVKMAYSYRVTPDMCDVVMQVAQHLTDEDVFRSKECPTDWGIVRFDHPLPVQDVRGATMLVHWLIWGPSHLTERDLVHPATAVWMFNDDDDFDEVSKHAYEEEPGFHERIREVSGRWNWVGFSVWEDGQSLGPPEIDPHEDYTDKQLEDMEIAVNNASRNLPPLKHQDFKPTTNSRRYLHALWLLLHQTIVAVEEEPLDRAVKRRARRMRIPERVTVIKMRRIEDPNRYEGESQVEWQHRWPVREHLAWRHCGKDKPGAVPYEKGWRRRIWIPMHWKGPEDAPIMITTKVFDVSR